MTRPREFALHWRPGSCRRAISPVGLRITAKLTFEEWRDLATSIGYASRSIAFIVGDWLVHGQSSFGPDAVPERRVPLDAYRQAIAATGMDLSTVQNYAYVRRITRHCGYHWIGWHNDC